MTALLLAAAVVLVVVGLVLAATRRRRAPRVHIPAPRPAADGARVPGPRPPGDHVRLAELRWCPACARRCPHETAADGAATCLTCTTTHHTPDEE
ncbi:hypothetical protein [Streptomyces sp. WMMC897]|uniref:hypothetical protein n=1 Tax=Streptomyces sp. WMMC897 TaxID=3014782 RepID=UPI0022B71BB1|nr:hypothetical protein [Streptomyces sp. WMMC897]MCZ7414280.1 hypothetical protein [Streptomyces sp. WMMC897]